MNNRKIFGFLSCILIFVLVLTGCGGIALEKASETMAGESASADPQLSASEAALETYRPRKDIETILIMGLDKYEAPENKIGYLNDQQCDFLMVFILDKKDKICDVLHLNRDTMTEIRRLGVGSKEAGKFTGQLALAHTYGSGGSDSCINACKAVSTLLKGVKIDHYIALTMAGVSKINDLVGGVEVQIPVDMTSVDPDFTEGSTVLLQGEQALKFVRARGELEDSSNLSRMERQRSYLTTLFEKLLFTSHQKDHFVHDSLLQLTSDMKSDLSINVLGVMAEHMDGFTLNPIVTIDGKAVKGKEFMEFYVDEDSLNEVLISLFTE